MPRDCDFNEEEVRKLKKIMYDNDRLMVAVLGDGNGNRGLLPRCEDFFIRQDEREKVQLEQERKKREFERRSRLLISIVGLIMTGLLVYCAIKESQRKDGQISLRHTVSQHFAIEADYLVGA